MKKVFIIGIICLFCSLSANAQNNKGSKGAFNAVQKIKVFPNPATNVINVLGLKNSRGAKILISDAYGNSAQEHQWEIRNNSLSIPITNLNSGIYIISIVSEEQQVKTKFYKK